MPSRSTAAPPPAQDPTAALIAALGRPDRAVHVVHTHISSVVLVDQDAYKLKKPLRLDFLDFSTLASRRRYCEEELRINRRTAPEVYLDVRPLYGPADAPRLGFASEEPPVGDAAHPVIDWVLHMRRFDETLTLDALDDRGELTPALIDAMARAMTALHASAHRIDLAGGGDHAEDAPRGPPTPPPLGHPDTALRWATRNLATLRTLPDAGPWQAAFDRLDTWTRDRFEALRPLMLTRLAQGQVRECHGDLHLGNWVRIDDRPVAFDAIEFNAELRWIDVISDLAFPVMDLLARGRPRLAWRLANAWFEATGDFEGAALLPWFIVYRALVRAKVALLQAAQEQGHERTASLERARRHVELARGVAHAPTPALVAVWGLSGSGKSTVAQVAAEHLGGLRLRSDVERKRLYGLSARERPVDTAPPEASVGAPSSTVTRDALYGPEATRRTYERLHALARALLRAGVSAVVDAACLRATERQALLDLGHQEGVPALLLHCLAPVDVLRARVTAREQRGDDASDAGLAVLERQLTLVEPPRPGEAAFTVDVDTDRPVAEWEAPLTRTIDHRRASDARHTRVTPAEPTNNAHAPCADRRSTPR